MRREALQKCTLQLIHTTTTIAWAWTIYTCISWCDLCKVADFIARKKWQQEKKRNETVLKLRSNLHSVMAGALHTHKCTHENNTMIHTSVNSLSPHTLTSAQLEALQ